MKKAFFQYFKMSEKEEKAFWQSCIFVFDTNVLLNLYRYSDPTRKDFIDTIKSVKDRIWIPHRVGEEYFDRRVNIIFEQEKCYINANNDIQKLEESLSNERSHPFINPKTLAEAKSFFKRLKQEISDNKDTYAKKITYDDVMSEVTSLFEDKVGEAYTKEAVLNLFKEGEVRYSERIPPGYKDAGKSSGENTFLAKCHIYGDLLIWKQIIDHAKIKKVNIAIVTDDSKEDWWERDGGKTIGPRTQLLKEFFDESKSKCYIYKPERFLELSKSHLGQKIKEGSVKEVSEIRNYSNNYKSIIGEALSRSMGSDIDKFKSGIEMSGIERFVDKYRRDEEEIRNKFSHTGISAISDWAEKSRRDSEELRRGMISNIDTTGIDRILEDRNNRLEALSIDNVRNSNKSDFNIMQFIELINSLPEPRDKDMLLRAISEYINKCKK